MAVAVVCAACVPPPGPMERLGNAAHELNTATRFARMDVAIALVDAERQGEFAARHSLWHRDLRIVDLELSGVQMVAAGEAQVHIVVMWHRLDETNVSVTSIEQYWKQNGEDWRLVEENPVSGSPGLFASPKPKAKTKQPKATGGKALERNPG